MASYVRIIYHVPDSAATMQALLNIDNNARTISGEAVQALHASVVDGAQVAFTKIATGVLTSSATLTSTGSAANNETASVANVTLTAKTSGAVAANGEFNISGTVAIQAANIAAAINAVPGLAGVVTATSLAGVVTITSVIPGKASNGLQISEALTNVTASAAFTGGSDGKQVSINNGLPS